MDHPWSVIWLRNVICDYKVHAITKYMRLQSTCDYKVHAITKKMQHLYVNFEYITLHSLMLHNITSSYKDYFFLN